MFPKYEYHFSNLHQNLILSNSNQNIAIQTFSSKQNILSPLCSAKIPLKHNEFQYFLANIFHFSKTPYSVEQMYWLKSAFKTYPTKWMQVWAYSVPSNCISITLCLPFIILFQHSMLLKSEQNLIKYINKHSGTSLQKSGTRFTDFQGLRKDLHYY